MKTVTEVHQDLQQAFDDLKSGSLDVKIASELHNNVGKQIGLVKLQIEYQNITKRTDEIEFLGAAKEI
jgi:hypothetical protein